jgi:hypothetical protein
MIMAKSAHHYWNKELQKARLAKTIVDKEVVVGHSPINPSSKCH